ncbi:MAG: hypothetical protein IJJ01_08875 [Firmicutes bacterium]|nr:hypothetical protein [Bacillota bacterium]
MNKEIKLAKLQKTSKVFAVIARVTEIVNYVGAAICAAAIPVLFAAPDKLKYFISGQEGDQVFQMLSENMEYRSAMVCFLIMLIVFTLACAYLFRKIGKLFRNINKDYSPFIPENVKLIRFIAVFVAVIMLFEASIIPAILIGLMLWAVSLLFDYGCELQNESDEIL